MEETIFKISISLTIKMFDILKMAHSLSRILKIYSIFKIWKTCGPSKFPKSFIRLNLQLFNLQIFKILIKDFKDFRDLKIFQILKMRGSYLQNNTKLKDLHIFKISNMLKMASAPTHLQNIQYLQNLKDPKDQRISRSSNDWFNQIL